jgi:SAM-dependent methyltransferase
LDHDGMPPEVYLHGHHDSVLRSHRWRTAENSAAYLLARLPADAHVLDVGCGPGTITVDLAARVPDGQVIGIDAAQEILAMARQEADRRDQRNVRFQTGDVYRLAFDDGTFDVVHAHQVLQHLSDPVGALAEMRRVCRTGGLIAARDGDYGGMFWFPGDPELTEWLGLYQTVARALGGEPDAGRRMRSWARAAGFAEVQASASAWCYTGPGDRTWWGESWAERLTDSPFGARAVEHGLATREDLQRLARAWRRWAAMTGPDTAGRPRVPAGTWPRRPVMSPPSPTRWVSSGSRSWAIPAAVRTPWPAARCCPAGCWPWSAGPGWLRSAPRGWTGSRAWRPRAWRRCTPPPRDVWPRRATRRRAPSTTRNGPRPISPHSPDRCPSAELRLYPDDGHISVLNYGAAALDWIAGVAGVRRPGG